MYSLFRNVLYLACEGSTLLKRKLRRHINSARGIVSVEAYIWCSLSSVLIPHSSSWILFFWWPEVARLRLYILKVDNLHASFEHIVMPEKKAGSFQLLTTFSQLEKDIYYAVMFIAVGLYTDNTRVVWTFCEYSVSFCFNDGWYCPYLVSEIAIVGIFTYLMLALCIRWNFPVWKRLNDWIFMFRVRLVSLLPFLDVLACVWGHAWGHYFRVSCF